MYPDTTGDGEVAGFGVFVGLLAHTRDSFVGSRRPIFLCRGSVTIICKEEKIHLRKRAKIRFSYYFYLMLSFIC